MSSVVLAEKNPDKLVIGIDQSQHRLAKYRPDTPKNLVLLQVNCEDFWRLCVENAIYFDEHYLLYPNPYPKSVHYKRRWHGHPVFPILPKLSKTLILRSNWRLYLEEFTFAWRIVTGQHCGIDQLTISSPMTLFEKKYAENQQSLYQSVLCL